MIDGWKGLVVRELRTDARRSWALKARVATVLAMSAAAATGLIVVWGRQPPSKLSDPFGPDYEVPATILRDGAKLGFLALLAMAALFLLGLIVREMSGAIADDRARGTLDGTLTTRLRAFEVVTGKLFSGLLRCASVLAAGLPLAVLLFAFGGAGLREAALGGVGLLSTGFFIGAVTVAVSVEARDKPRAQGRATLLVAAWLDVPFLLAAVGPRRFPGVYGWIAPPVEIALASSPIGVFAHYMRLRGGQSLEAIMLKMVALELAAGSILVLIAVARLRPAARRLGGEPSALAKPKAKGRTVGRRPSCGDDPMDWKERLAARVSWGGLALGAFTFGALFLSMAAVSFGLAWPAWGEVVVSGYASAMPEDARWAYNQSFLRPLTGVVVFALMAVLAGTTAESLDLERKRDTWLVLLSTPLTAAEILGAKRRASWRRCRPLAAALIGVWCVGTVTGAVHPLGLLAALASLWAALRFSSALGAYSAVRAAGKQPGTNLALLVLVAGALFAPLAALISGRPEGLAVAAASPPFTALMSLLSWDEVRAAFGGDAFGGLQSLRVARSPEGGGWLLLSAVLGPAWMVLATWWLDRGVDRHWDRSVGRPIQAEAPF